MILQTNFQGLKKIVKPLLTIIKSSPRVEFVLYYLILSLLDCLGHKLPLVGLE